MKYVLISLLLSANLAFTQTAENKSGDSLNNSFIARMFYDNPSIKHHHIVDVSLIDFGFSTLGYNYLYSINQNIRVGTRLGLYLKHLDKNKYPTSILGVRLGFSGSYRIWKSIYAEASVSFIQAYGISAILGNGDTTKGNPQDFYGKSTSIFPMYELGVNWTMYNHFFVRTGLNVTQDVPANLYYKGYYLSFGYKF